MLGHFVYSIRSRFGHGLNVAYARDILRPKILKTRPVRDTDDASAEIHVMTSKGDWLNLIWTLKSFYHYSRRRYRLCIHEDGSASAEAIAQLRHHFPAARIVARRDADAKIFAELSAY